jgi:outer membrane immunogenic protein
MSIFKNHRELWLASAVALALTGTAGAADLAVKAPIVAPAPVFSWTGCYIGGHAGGGVMSDSYVNYDDGGAYGYAEADYRGRGRRRELEGFDIELYNYGPADNDLWRSAGGIAGGQIGCNYQIGSYVIGLEAEGFWSGLKNKNEYGEAYDEYSYHRLSEFKNKGGWDVAVRLGYAIDRLLVYSKVGWAWGKFDASYNEFESILGGHRTWTYQESADANMNGILLGFGTEYALTQNWTIKAEYNFMGFKRQTFSFPWTEVATHDCGCDFGNYTDTGSYTQSHSVNEHIVKVGVNYLFNWGAPVVARY